MAIKRLNIDTQLKEAYDLLDVGILIVNQKFSILLLNQWILKRLPEPLHNTTDFMQVCDFKGGASVLAKIRSVFENQSPYILSPVFHQWVIPLKDNKFQGCLRCSRG